MNLYPTITKPSRVSSHSATVIDNILTNNMRNVTISDLLICDATDHLPVFTIGDKNYMDLIKKEKCI